MFPRPKTETEDEFENTKKADLNKTDSLNNKDSLN